MSKFLELALGTAVCAVLAVPAMAEPLGIGRPALPEEIAAWDKDVSPTGVGLPVGSGDVLTGEELFSANCAVCHGEFGEGQGNWPKLAGGMDTLADADPLKTMGSYWPHLSTAWDYVNRSMPFGAAQTLGVDEVYAIVAYMLYNNDLVDDDFVLSNENFTEVVLPNAGGFFVDDRDTVEVPLFSVEPCMENCKDSVEITAHATVLDVTPNDTSDDAAAAEPAAEPVIELATSEPEAAAETVVAVAAEPATAVATLDPALVAEGETVFRKCSACHKVGADAKNGVGPILTQVIGSPAGSVEGFKYSKPLLDMAGSGLTWDEASLHAFLENPKKFMRGTKMAFAGLKDEGDRAAVIAYLASVAN